MPRTACPGTGFNEASPGSDRCPQARPAIDHHSLSAHCARSRAHTAPPIRSRPRAGRHRPGLRPCSKENSYGVMAWHQGQMGTRRARRAPSPLTVNTVLESLYPIRLRPHSKFFDLSYFTRSTVTHWQRMGREEGQEVVSSPCRCLCGNQKALGEGVGLRSEGEQRVRRKGETGEK